MDFKEVIARMDISDNSGNRIYVKNNDLFLSLASEDRVRDIGSLYISKKGNIVYKKSGLVESVHVFRRNDSWGLHWGVINALPDDVIVLLVSDIKRYYLPVRDIKEHGRFMHFLTQGFEKQIFVRREHWSVL